MKVGVIGSGRMGRALGAMALAAGHDVTFGSRTPGRGEAVAGEVEATLGERAGGRDGAGGSDVSGGSDLSRGRDGSGPSDVSGGDYADAAAGADLVLLATLWAETREALEEARIGDGTVVLDATNPEAPDGRSLLLGHTTSGAEEIQGWIPGARVVKAFNHVYAELVEGRSSRDRGPRPAALLCGDDDEANRVVAELARAGGFDPVDLGPLRNARYQEPFAQLVVQLVRERGWPPATALRLVRPG